MRRGGEDGYALVAAVASIAVFAAMALTILTGTRAATVGVAAEVGRARASAAAEAGIALALSGLLTEGVGERWAIDGRPRRLRFGEADLLVRVQDERGKVPLALLDENSARRLLETAGLGGERLLVARDGLLDWVDDDDDTRPDGAERAYYEPRGVAVRNGPFQSVDELALVRGLDDAVVERLRDLVSADFARGSFDARNASSRAIRVMRGEADGAIDELASAREEDGQRVAIELVREEEVIGRPLTILVEARLPDGARAVRRVVVELTGSPTRPYVIRSYD